MHTYSCRYPHLARVLAAVEGVDVGDTEPCERPALWATTIWREPDGLDSETTARTCRDHDAKVRDLPGYQDSIPLPRP
jgi:hypothetical protein